MLCHYCFPVMDKQVHSVMLLHAGKQIISSICISLIGMSWLNWFGISAYVVYLAQLSAGFVLEANYSYATIYDYYH